MGLTARITRLERVQRPSGDALQRWLEAQEQIARGELSRDDYLDSIEEPWQSIARRQREWVDAIVE